jgi:hypothetical protein
MTEDDVAAVLFARTIRESGADDSRMAIFLALTLDAAERVRSYTASHLGQSLIVDFDGETRYEIRIGGPIGAEMQIDVSALGLSPERFESEYLSD